MPEKEDTTIATKKKGWMKWLSRFGHFLMYGGWILLAVIILGIILAASTC